ncbi:MAG: F0F1 ATP synthase subunit B [Geodermatophilaceae bacterium]|nr:F0F1 ATP synthase subunit B [Geodermatophilaceae bacterium]
MELGILAAEEGSNSGGNFLIPNGTFLFELLLFLLILFVLGRFVVPPIQQAMRKRAEIIEQGAEDAQRAKDRAEEAHRAYREELNAARTEGSQIRDKARGEAEKKAEVIRRAASQEASAEGERAASQLQGQRERAQKELRASVGTLAADLSTRILGTDYSADEQIAATVTGYLEGLRSTEDDTATAEQTVHAGGEHA